MAEVYDDTELLIAGLAGVRAARKEAAQEIATKARARLAQHRDTGAARIVVEHDRLNSDVILDDPASIYIESGRNAYTRSDGREIGAMAPLAILRGSL